MPAETYEAISTVTLSNDVQFVTISNIPQNYTDLVIVIDGTSTASTYIRARFNEGLPVSYQDTLMNNSSPYNPSSFGGTGGFTGLAGNSTRSQIFFNFLNYSNGNIQKTYIAESRQGNSTSYWSSSAGVIATTSPSLPQQITSFGYHGDSGNVQAGTVISVYGLSASGLKATGGNVIGTDGTYWYHAFTASGTFTPKTSLTCDILVVAGGGSGGWPYAGGGGAGGLLLHSAQALTQDTAYTVTVGAGGTGGYNTGHGQQGGNSQFGSLTAAVGGGGGLGDGSNSSVKNGGSGGGGAPADRNSAGSGGGTATSGQGSAGGNGSGLGSTNTSGGGGGGAGGAGANGTTTSGGAGGAGVNTYSTWLATLMLGDSQGYVAGGGGGGTNGAQNQVGAGGAGGGGSGASNDGLRNSERGMKNTGGGSGGGGAGNASQSPQSGGSGLVIVRYVV